MPFEFEKKYYEGLYYLYFAYIFVRDDRSIKCFSKRMVWHRLQELFCKERKMKILYVRSSTGSEQRLGFNHELFRKEIDEDLVSKRWGIARAYDNNELP